MLYLLVGRVYRAILGPRAPEGCCPRRMAGGGREGPSEDVVAGANLSGSGCRVAIFFICRLGHRDVGAESLENS